VRRGANDISAAVGRAADREAVRLRCRAL